MINIKKSIDDLNIEIIAVKMGNDFNISILGGDKPHIGAVALAIPRGSLEDKERISASVSLLTVVGHKEDEIAMSVAKSVTKAINAVVAVSCGIHKDNITFREIKEIIKLVDEGIDELILKLT